MIYFLLFLLFPLCAGAFFKLYLHKTYTWTEFGLNVGFVAILCGITFLTGTYQSLNDIEIWNGKIINKHRVHGHYEEAYDCFCSETCTGSGSNQSCYETCSTCYEDHYTVEWYATSSVGEIRFKYLDSTSKSVYNEPDPILYKNCVEGEPASRAYNYINYVKAVPDSLFNTKMDDQVYADKIPNYPSVYDLYKLNRVINIDSTIPAEDIKTLNDLLGKSLISLGNLKQVNVIIILTELDDPFYRNVVENAWIGGKKNDVIVFIGLDGNSITWVDVMTWALNSGNEVFHVELRDSLYDVETFNSKQINGVVSRVIFQYYDRPQMADYMYLKDQIEPPGWVLFVCMFFSIVGTLILTYVFHKNDFNHRRFR